MDRLRRRPEPAAIDISWVSCRGVRSSVPFHTPCLYASVYLTPASPRGDKRVQGRRPHRVKTPTDRAGGKNPEWDAPLRLYVPAAAAGIGKSTGTDGIDGGSDVFLLRFELKSEVAVLGDVLAASAVVPVSDLVTDGRTRRVSYRLTGSDGRQPNGVISFSYAFHGRGHNDGNEDCGSDVDGGKIVETLRLRCLAAACAVAQVPPSLPPAHSTAASGLYPAMEWALTEQVDIYPTATSGMAGTPSRYCSPPLQATLVEPVGVSPPSPLSSSSCGVYPTVGEPAAASRMYPTVDLAPVSCSPCNGGGCGYAAAPEWDGRCLYS